MGSEIDLQHKYDLIPEGTDILISHSPPLGILDDNVYGEPCGSISLLQAIDRIKPKYCIYGHIHEQGGKKYQYGNCLCINASHVNKHYKPVNKPVRIVL